jgi:predicted SPOUT superfamily RNA methylase MTH1
MTEHITTIRLAREEIRRLRVELQHEKERWALEYTRANRLEDHLDRASERVHSLAKENDGLEGELDQVQQQLAAALGYIGAKCEFCEGAGEIWHWEGRNPEYDDPERIEPCEDCHGGYVMPNEEMNR